MLCVICILSLLPQIKPAAEDFDAAALADATLSFRLKDTGADTVQEYIDGFLTDNAGSVSEWMMMALTRMDRGYDFGSYSAALDKYVKENNIASASTRQLYSLLFIFTGDAENAFIKKTMSDSIGQLGIMSYVFALHLFNNGCTSSDHTAASVTDQLLSMQLSDGGWAVSGQYSDPDVTSMTIQALAYGYDVNERVKNACDNALAFLSKRQNDDGCFSSYGVKNAESTAQVIIAASSLGIDLKNDKRFIKNGNTVIDGLLKFRMPDGSFRHKEGGEYSSMATIQALSAFIAIDRKETGRSIFYINRPIRPGDISLDGEIDSADAYLALSYDAGVTALSAERKYAGDVNRDKEVDSLDAASILKYDAGSISSF